MSQIQIQNQPITFPGNAKWEPEAMTLTQNTAGDFKGFWTVQNPAGKFLSVQPNGSYEWVDKARGVYENFPSLDSGCIVVQYLAPPDQSLPILFKIPFSGL